MVCVVLDHLLPPPLQRWENASVEVVDAKGALLRPFATEEGAWRLATTPSEVDPLFLAFLKCVEDQRFDWHGGVDPLAVFRAAIQAVSHGRIVSGASTLSMQAARLLEPKARTLRAKLIESMRALQLHAHLGHRGVLSVYLTLAPYGGAVEGTRAASLVWYGHEPSHLTPAEAALLVALPQSPERLRPDRHPEAARIARDKVLDIAVDKGLLTPDQAIAAKAEPIPRVQRPMPIRAPHLAERLVAQKPQARVIQSWIDPLLQSRLEDLVFRERDRMSDSGDLAVIVVSNRDRRIIGYAGSGDWRERPLDLAQAKRSPGSALKPFIYALAFDDLSLHPGTLIEDTPWRFGDWMPRNFDHDFHGVVTVRDALQRSLNIPAVLALDRVGPARLVALLRQCGTDLVFPDGADVGLPLALGGVGISLSDLTMLYTALADGGKVLPLKYSADQTEDPSCALVGDAAAWAVMDILDGMPAPEGMIRQTSTAKGRTIGYKTGTSFGYRDAWSLGSSPDYTVGVWVGRPDGGPRPGQLGRIAAAPILYRVFSLLPDDTTERRRPEERDSALLRAAPPKALARVSVEGGDERMAERKRRLRVLFPPNGATVETSEQGIALKAEGGTSPLQWVANGKPLAKESRFWMPDGQGFATLAVIDAEGRRAAVTIRIANTEN